jgi:hypothetical protein
VPNSPYRAPYQRGTFAHRLGKTTDVHVLQRNSQSAYFKARNPDGFQHDLGAQDVFLDNLGIACFEQLDGDLLPKYLDEVERSLVNWERTREWVLPDPPWTGKYIDAKRRANAAAGEPRPRLRLLEEGALAPPKARPDIESEEELRRSRSWPRNLGELFGLDPDHPPARGSSRPFQRREHGLILPEEFVTPVSSVRLLPIKHCTPDLPARVGVSDRDLDIYQETREARDQGSLATCVSFATTFAIEVAARRASLAGLPQLSPAWLHLSTGTIADGGRTLRDIIRCVEKDGLPCSEMCLPYAELEEGRVTKFEDITEAAHEDHSQIEGSFDAPICFPIPRGDIGLMKTLLAAGWVLLLGTAIHDDFQRPGPMALGLPLLPLVGARRVAAHAWCVFGYDHTDGALNWKYQGRFIALNSWGPSAHLDSPYGPGTISLPFSYVWQHGIEAYAIRFPRQ